MTQRQTAEYYEDVKRQYVAWSAMTASERKQLKLPGSKAEFARTFEVGDRTVRKWDSEIADEVEALKVKKVVQSGGRLVETAVTYDQMTNAELLSDIIRKQLVAAAKGDDSAMNFLRANQQILKPLIDALNEEFVSDFESVTDDELVAKFLDSFEADCVLVLRDRGWTVEKEMA
jgi:hypothetical protein